VYSVSGGGLIINDFVQYRIVCVSACRLLDGFDYAMERTSDNALFMGDEDRLVTETEAKWVVEDNKKKHIRKLIAELSNVQHEMGEQKKKAAELTRQIDAAYEQTEKRNTEK
jgi:hypothetical protein